MLHRQSLLSVVFCLASITPAYASESAQGSGASANAILQEIVRDNGAFVKSHSAKDFAALLTSQSPRATLVMCSDSRVHTQAFDKTPDGDLFIIRNIGNQFETAQGSIEYGVHHLHTPLLMVVGHVGCGAVKAAMGDYKSLEAPIKRELDTLKVPAAKGDNFDQQWLSNVKLNVDAQVEDAMKYFAAEVKAGKLAVVGAVYDFRNDFKQGNGKLVVTNINGEKDAEKIKRSPLLTTATAAAANAPHQH